MVAETKNLCAQIPIDLHRRVREHQEQSGKSLGEYMTWLITTFYQSEEEQKMTNTDEIHDVTRIFEMLTVTLCADGKDFQAFRI